MAHQKHTKTRERGNRVEERPTDKTRPGAKRDGRHAAYKQVVVVGKLKDPSPMLEFDAGQPRSEHSRTTTAPQPPQLCRNPLSPSIPLFLLMIQTTKSTYLPNRSGKKA